MDANISGPRYMPGMPFENGSALPPYPYPHPLHNQHPFTHPPPQPNPFVANGQRFDANWLASLPPPPPPIPFPQAGSRPPFDGHPLFPQIPFLPPNAQNPQQNVLTQSGPSQEYLPTAPSKEHAKEAVLAMVRADITYNDLVAEGIKAPLLNALFTELNLPLPKPVVDPPEAIEAIDPAMERKDRIAKLLAAKKFQSATASPKEPAQPVEPTSTPELLSRKQSPLPPAVKQAHREENKSDFSIPGLFMTSAEQEEILPDLPVPVDAETAKKEEKSVVLEEDNVSVEEQVPTNVIAEEQDPVSVSGIEDMPSQQPSTAPQASSVEVRSLKRGPEPFSANVMPESKRQVSISQESAPISDSERAVDTVINSGRSKVNQNILKDRMAALKADLLLKNSRKKALQDGMPVLNAEVQKTRERLEDNEARLRDVRAEIEDKVTQLNRLREEESYLHEEVQRLKGQLADGETGQQQFSKELTQLNDQIMADENESRISQPSNLPSSPVAARTEGPVQQQSALKGSHDSLPQYCPRPAFRQVSIHERNITAEEQETSTTHAQEDTQRTETEYSPEQEDIDRQLNQEVIYTVAQTQPAEIGSLRPPQIENERSPPFPEVTAEAVSGPESEHDSDDDRMSIDEADEIESVGSASMSDSGSDEYEPPIHLDTSNEVDEDEADDDYEPQEMNVDLQESSDEADNDDYEPSEQVNVLNVDALEVLRRDGDDGAIPVEEQHSDDINTSVQVQTAAADPTSSPHGSEKQLILASSPEAVAHESLSVSQLEPLSNSFEGLHAVPRFVPYSSPLSNMKQFRFNSQFNDVVKDGYRSLTYSHQIDKDTPLCPIELSGTVCTDGECEEQHFSRVALTDDKILVQMSSANHIKDKGQRDKYLIGLKKVIADLRERGVKEFSEVANALATYRRDQAMSQNGLVS